MSKQIAKTAKKKPATKKEQIAHALAASVADMMSVEVTQCIVWAVMRQHPEEIKKLTTRKLADLDSWLEEGGEGWPLQLEAYLAVRRLAYAAYDQMDRDSD